MSILPTLKRRNWIFLVLIAVAALLGAFILRSEIPAPHFSAAIDGQGFQFSDLKSFCRRAPMPCLHIDHPLPCITGTPTLGFAASSTHFHFTSLFYDDACSVQHYSVLLLRTDLSTDLDPSRDVPDAVAQLSPSIQGSLKNCTIPRSHCLGIRQIRWELPTGHTATLAQLHSAPAIDSEDTFWNLARSIQLLPL